ncbi:MAG: DUF1003 domain-containing protein [Deltaproteobacteria bacterium]|nr:DUF1003 domain-containing protein [Deltaproteobacteria bacterium]
MADNPQMQERRCQICGRREDETEVLVAGLVRPVVSGLIRQTHPSWSEEGFICLEDLNRFRNQYVLSLIETEKGELSDLEKEVLESITRHEILATHTDQEYETQLSFGQHLSDRLARFGGSWRFILIFAGILVVWVLINTIVFIFKPFDPYPFILLNLILSCLAALQAPIIMMSQNRQEEKDRLRAMHDYQVNLKAELEIRQLHQKLDHLLSHQWERLVEIQEVQMELLTEMRGTNSKPNHSNSSPGKDG